MDVKSGATKAEDVAFPLRWGIIGASRIGSDWIKCLADVPGASLAAVAARDMGRAQEYAEAHGIPTAYDSYETLVSDPEVDIVYIGTKTDDHHAHTMLAIQAVRYSPQFSLTFLPLACSILPLLFAGRGSTLSARSRSARQRPRRWSASPQPPPRACFFRRVCGRDSSRLSSTRARSSPTAPSARSSPSKPTSQISATP